MICLIPKIAEHVVKWDSSFEQPIQDLAIAVCCRFENLAEFAQPQSFWAPHKKKAKATLTPSKKRKPPQVVRADSESDIEEEDDTHKKPRSNECVQKSSDKPISLLFKPLLL